MKKQSLFCFGAMGVLVLGLASVRLLAYGSLELEAETWTTEMLRSKPTQVAEKIGRSKDARQSTAVKALNRTDAKSSTFSAPNAKLLNDTNVVVEIPNRLIDSKRFLIAAEESVKLRESRRLTEEQFLKMCQEEGVVILDARSRDRYEEIHVRGAISLPFTDISFDSLAQHLPNKETRILIYCNNNFEGNLPEFQAKSQGTSLNLSTFATLYEYGYRNIYELGPALEIDQTKITFEGTSAKRLAAK